MSNQHHRNGEHQRLDLADIQGNVIRAYGRFGYPKARYFFLHVHDAASGRAFVNELFPSITTATRWNTGKPSNHYPGNQYIDRPEVTLNIGFSYSGLQALGLPTRSLSQLPPEFIDGMAGRSHILGDVEGSAKENWDEIWQNSVRDDKKRAHIWISMNALADTPAAMERNLKDRTSWLEARVGDTQLRDRKGKQIEASGVEILSGHGANGQKYQEASVIVKQVNGKPQVFKGEHFGYRDGIGDPVFDGQFTPSEQKARVVGRGKIMPDGTWAALATGEFLLGHPDESQEIPTASLPPEFARNGTFMVYRKLNQDVDAFNAYIDRTAKSYAKVMEMDLAEAKETLKAKMVGRWTDGTPLVAAPTLAEKEKFRDKFNKDMVAAEASGDQAQITEILQRETDFKYGDDFGGLKCPYGAHLRRGNARDMLDPDLGPDQNKAGQGSALNKRRRILRRGLPYDDGANAKNKKGDKGIIFMALCANLFRQFEFVQQQWIQYGLDFQAGNDTCPVIGHHRVPDSKQSIGSKFVIPVDPDSGKPPYVCSSIPPLVNTRGGEYFFIPGMTALRMIAMGIVDPT